MIISFLMFVYAFLNQKMARIPSFMVVLLFLGLWTAIANGENYKYKDPKQPLNVRIKDLLSLMTLEEKIGQMVQIDRSVASAEVMKKYFIGNSHNPCSLFTKKTMV